MRMLGHADEAHRAVALQKGGEGVEIVACRDRVQDEIEAVGLGLHLLAIARDDDLVGAEIERVLALVLRRREGDDMSPHRVGELDAHMAEPADSDDPDPLAGPDLPVAERRPGGDPGAEQGRRRRELLLGMADPEDEALVDRDALRIAPERMAGLVLGRAVIGADDALLAILLEALVAGGATAAASDEAADPDRFARLEAGDFGADRRDMPHDLVAGYARIKRSAPFRPYRVQVRMADAAKSDVDLDVLRAGFAAMDVHRF